MKSAVPMINQEEKTYQETIIANNMEKAKLTAKRRNPAEKIISANWVYK